MEAAAVEGTDGAGPEGLACPACKKVMKTLHGLKIHQGMSGCGPGGRRKRARKARDDADDHPAPAAQGQALPDFSEFVPPDHELQHMSSAIFTPEDKRQLEFCYSYVLAQLGHEC